MGAWGAKPFQNDPALDWLLDLADADDDGPIVRALQASADADAAIAAAAVVAAAATEPVRGVPSEAKTWIRRQGYVPSRQTIQQALAQLERVRADAELRDLWSSPSLLKAWDTAVGKISRQLQVALETEPPTRVPSRARTPRSLYKLVNLMARDPSEAIRAKIRERLTRLSHPDLSCAETDHQPPLCMLAESGLVDEVKFLLDRGADPSIDTFLSASPLSIACGRGDSEIAKVLIAAGARLLREALVDVKTGLTVDVKRPGRKTRSVRYCPALWQAVTRGTPEVIDILVAAGAELSQVDLNGDTLLHKACEADRPGMIELLVARGLDVNQTTADLRSPLHAAASGNHLDCARVLLDSGADPNIADARGHTALDYAEDLERPVFALIRSFGGRLGAEIKTK